MDRNRGVDCLVLNWWMADAQGHGLSDFISYQITTFLESSKQICDQFSNHSLVRTHFSKDKIPEGSLPLTINVQYYQRMGCQVTSVYNDQVLGKIGLPQPLLEDLVVRDYGTAHTLPNPMQLSTQLERIYGFNQLSLSCGLFLTSVTDRKQQQSVYAAGRFIVMEGPSLKSKQEIMTNEDVVTALAVEEGVCLVGLKGGGLILWSLQFKEKKIEITLPQECLVVSSVGITPKYLIATDSSQPNNFIFFYQRRTAKLKAYSKIPSLEPVIKAITVRNTHITATADGLWFFSQRNGEVQLLKGMFGKYPKTSMLCLGASGDYVVSGGIDGYLYVWRASTGQCIKALRVCEGEIGSIGVGSGHLVMGCWQWQGKVKVYSFAVAAAKKKVYNINIEDEQQQPQQTITFILVDSYDVSEMISRIAFSTITPYMYMFHTREGVSYRYSLPNVQQQARKIDWQEGAILRWNRKANKQIHQHKIYSIYAVFRQIVKIDQHQIVNNHISFIHQRKLNFKVKLLPDVIAFDPITGEVVSVDQEGSVWAGELLESQLAMVGVVEENIRKITELGKEVKKIQFVRVSQEVVLLCITNQHNQLWIFNRKDALQYEQLQNFSLPKETPPQIELESGTILRFEPLNQTWNSVNNQPRMLSERDRQFTELVHGGPIDSLSAEWSSLKASAGGDMLLFWK